MMSQLLSSSLLHQRSTVPSAALHHHHQQNPNLPLSDRDVSVHEEDEEFEINPFQFDPLSPPNTAFSLPNPNNNLSFVTESNPESIRFDGEDSYSDQMNFVTDLFSPREQYPCSNFSPFTMEPEFDHDLGFDPVTQLGELGQLGVPRGADSSIGGLRVLGLESDLDYEGLVRDEDLFGDLSVPFFWDEGEIDEENGGVNLESEWEEVGEQRGFERDPLGSVIEQIGHLSVSPDISNMVREEIGDGEWEFLLAVNNLESNIEFENESFESFGEYDEILRQVMENGVGNKGSPPTAKSVVENLPIVVCSEEMKRETIICAICKDILVDDKVTKLPCCHFYHGDCIIPWLNIRNTCPMCRYELPTDDPDYERRKSHEGEADLPRDLLVRYIFNPIS